MATPRTFLATVLLIFSFISTFQEGESIKCYVCDSATNKKCASSDELSSELTECPSVGGFSSKKILDELEIIRDVGNSTLVNLTGVDQARVGIPQVIPACYKVIAEIGGITVVDRGCTFKEGFGLICDKITSANGIIRFCAPCNEFDGCNSSTVISLTSILLIFSTGLSHYFSF